MKFNMWSIRHLEAMSESKEQKIFTNKPTNKQTKNKKYSQTAGWCWWLMSKSSFLVCHQWWLPPIQSKRWQSRIISNSAPKTDPICLSICPVILHAYNCNWLIPVCVIFGIVTAPLFGSLSWLQLSLGNWTTQFLHFSRTCTFRRAAAACSNIRAAQQFPRPQSAPTCHRGVAQNQAFALQTNAGKLWPTSSFQNQQSTILLLYKENKS